MNRAIAIIIFALLIVLPLSAEHNQAAPKSVSGVVTLYSRDALSRTLCFSDGAYGSIVQEDTLKNRCSDLGFDFYHSGNFTAGIEGNRVASILDLGTEQNLSARYGFEQTLGDGQGFASLHVSEHQLVIRKGTIKQRAMQVVPEALPLFDQTNLRPLATVPVQIGHVYVLRIADRDDPTVEVMAKLVVVDYTRNESVTFRWQSL